MSIEHPALAMPVMAVPYVPVQSQKVTFVYNGSLAAGASSMTVHWGYNNWTSPADVRDDEAERRVMAGDRVRSRLGLVAEHRSLQPEFSLG